MNRCLWRGQHFRITGTHPLQEVFIYQVTTRCVIYFVSPKRGKPPNAITVTDLADFYICPRRFLYRKVLGQKLTYAMINGARAHAKKYNEHKERAEKKIELGLAVDLAQSGEELIGREVEIYGNGLYGIMDEIRLYPEEAVIIDFKASLSERGKIQTLAYATALRNYGYERITVRIVRTKDEEPLWEKEFGENDRWFIESLKQRFYATIRAGIFPKKENPELCESCPFGRICNG
ncbi:MAG: Dna2/Cas4 domain-containing protein [Candidatus Diapherotrites archaeon]|nr:Dna2/Cas4 domain-containing protein [Candidatus Diapherotrites archaeon]